MQAVTIIHNPLDRSTWKRHETPDIRELLTQELASWPPTARIYHGAVAVENDVTPHTPAEVERLARLEGELTVVIYPEDPITIIVAVVAVAVTAAAAFLLLPSSPDLGNRQAQSPNNELSARVNKPRPGGRIPDIYGQVRSTPDLIMVPLRHFENHQEIELAYMCIGRGTYDIDNVRDGDTLIEDIAGAAVEVYGPGTSPNSGDTPQLTIGSPIDREVVTSVRLNEVNGQVLRPPNSNHVQGDRDIRFVYPDKLQRTGSEVDFAARFDPGDSVTISGATVEGTTTSVTKTVTMRFESADTIRFSSYNPTTDFAAGDTVTLTNAAYAAATSALSPYTLLWSNPAFPTGHSTVLDRIKSVKLVGANPAKFYRAYHLFFKDIGTRAALWIYQADDASGTNSVAVAAWVVGSGASNVGIETVTLAAQGGSGITGEATIDFGDGATPFAVYNGTHANSGLIDPPVVTGGQASVQFIDLVGTYVVASLTSTTMVLTSPSSVNGDWSKLANYPSSRTEYETSSLAKSGTSGPIDLGGVFTVLSASASELVLSNPATVNSAWGTPLQSLPGSATGYLSPSISTTGESWIGPFIVDAATTDRVLANFVALQGLFTDNGKKQRPFPVQVLLEATPVDNDGDPIGAPEEFYTTVEGNSDGRETRASSLWATLASPGRYSIRAKRVTPTDLNFEGTVVDEVKWRDAYGLSPVDVTDFGDVTTVMAQTYATAGALTVKDRKLNMLVTRHVPIRVSGTTFDPPAPTTSADDIIAAVCLDPHIGNRSLSELDLDEIYSEIAEVRDYFGTAQAADFSYTFDDSNMSFEETLTSIARAVFCTAYRRGSILGLTFERATEDSRLLFNHRNKLPGSETRTVRFGNQDDNDGIELEYVDPADDANVTFYIPEDRSAVNPKNVKVIGIRTHEQAYWAAWRLWNKIRYQNTATEFEATQEAALMVATQRCLVADNTRPDTQDGQVVAQDGLELTLSQPVEMEEGVDYTIFLQHVDGSVEGIPIAPGDSAMKVLLDRAPRMALALDAELFAQTIYQVVADDNPRQDAFLLVEKEAETNYNYKMRAVNYSPLYYMCDQLIVWLQLAGDLLDRGPLLNDSTDSAGGGSFVTDDVRGLVHEVTSSQPVEMFGVTATESYTKALWVRPSDLASPGHLLSSATAGAGDTSLSYSASGGELVLGHNNGASVITAPFDAEDEWSHVVATYDEETGEAALYINGDQVAADELPAHTPGQTLRLGQGTGVLPGRYSDVRVLRRALQPPEVRALHRATRIA